MKSERSRTINERLIQIPGCLLIILTGFLLLTCGPKSGTSMTILLDESYSTDWARTSLWTTDHISCHVGKPVAAEPWECEAAAEDERDFIRSFSTAFASDSACSGLELIVSDIVANPDAEIPLRDSSKVRSAWLLWFGYTRRTKKWSQWTLDRMPALNTSRQGEGSPSQIARQVCTIVTG